MKKTLVILGSPRKEGNSAALAGAIMEGIREAGGEAEAIYLNSMSIKPCQACEYCHGDKGRLCAIRDDMQQIYPKLLEADSLVLASPIYMFTVTAQLKLFMDRTYAVLKEMKGKRIGIALTYGDTDEISSGAINAIGTMKDEFRFTQSEIVGIVHGTGNKPGEITQNTELMEQAVALGKKLAQPYL